MRGPPLSGVTLPRYLTGARTDGSLDSLALWLLRLKSGLGACHSGAFSLSSIGARHVKRDGDRTARPALAGETRRTPALSKCSGATGWTPPNLQRYRWARFGGVHPATFRAIKARSPCNPGYISIL